MKLSELPTAEIQQLLDRLQTFFAGVTYTADSVSVITGFDYAVAAPIAAAITALQNLELV